MEQRPRYYDYLLLDKAMSSARRESPSLDLRSARAFFLRRRSMHLVECIAAAVWSGDRPDPSISLTGTAAPVSPSIRARAHSAESSLQATCRSLEATLGSRVSSDPPFASETRRRLSSCQTASRRWLSLSPIRRIPSSTVVGLTSSSSKHSLPEREFSGSSESFEICASFGSKQVPLRSLQLSYRIQRKRKNWILTKKSEGAASGN